MEKSCLCVLLALLLTCFGAFAQADTGWTPSQQQWLQSHPEIRLGIILNPPYARLDPRTHQPQGLAIDYLALLEQDLGVHFKIEALASEAELTTRAQTQAIDMVLGVEQTPEYLRYWNFSEAFLRQSNVLVTRRSEPLPDWPRMPANSKLLIPSQKRITFFLQRNYPDIPIREISEAQTGLQALIAGKASAVVLDQAQARYWLQEPQFAALQMGNDIGYPSLLRIGVRHDWPELTEILDQSMSHLPHEQIQQIEQRWIPDDQGPWWNQPLLWGGIALASLSIAILFAFMAARNRRLGEQTSLQLRQLEEELRTRQKLAQALSHTQFSVDHSPVGILRLCWDGRIQYVNEAMCKLLDQDEDALLQSRFQSIDPYFADNNAHWLAFWNGLCRQNFRTYETELKKGHQLIPAEIHACHQSYGDQEYLVLFMTDISERNRIRLALEESETRFRELANHVPGMVFQLRQACEETWPTLAYLGDACTEFCGYPADYILKRPAQLLEMVYPQDCSSFEGSLASAVASHSTWNWQGRIVTDRGEIKWVDLKASRREEANGAAIWDGMAWDITANKRIEQSLGESRLLLRELAAHHESLREREKASIAREVHDELGQILTAMKIETSVCELALNENQPQLAHRMAGLKKLIDQTLQISRNVVTALRPPALDLGLLPALEWLTQRVEDRLQLQCEMEIDQQIQEIDEARSVILFRIIQEALTNVARHAKANWVLIRIEYRAHDLCLRIEDNGCGFDPESISRTFGLVGIRERVWMLRGELEIDSAPGAGTRIIVSIPHPGESYDSRSDR